MFKGMNITHRSGDLSIARMRCAVGLEGYIVMKLRPHVQGNGFVHAGKKSWVGAPKKGPAIQIVEVGLVAQGLQMWERRCGADMLG